MCLAKIMEDSTATDGEFDRALVELVRSIDNFLQNLAETSSDHPDQRASSAYNTGSHFSTAPMELSRRPNRETSASSSSFSTQRAAYLQPNPSSSSTLRYQPEQLSINDRPRKQESISSTTFVQERIGANKKPSPVLPARSMVQHAYNDLTASDTKITPSQVESTDVQDIDSGCDVAVRPKKKLGRTKEFPLTLYSLLEKANEGGYSDIVSWQSHGRAFRVHNPTRFVKEIMPQFFKQTRITSFQRQLSMYGFVRLTKKNGKDYGAYYNERFLRGHRQLANTVERTPVQGTWVQKITSPETEPDFYKMDPVWGPSPGQSVVDRHDITTSADNSGDISRETSPDESAELPAATLPSLEQTDPILSVTNIVDHTRGTHGAEPYLVRTTGAREVDAVSTGKRRKTMTAHTGFSEKERSSNLGEEHGSSMGQIQLAELHSNELNPHTSCLTEDEVGSSQCLYGRDEPLDAGAATIRKKRKSSDERSHLDDSIETIEDGEAVADDSPVTDFVW